jgi:hypothetical protein
MTHLDDLNVLIVLIVVQVATKEQLEIACRHDSNTYLGSSKSHCEHGSVGGDKR